MRLAELDYLRGFAAFAVLIFHFMYKGIVEGWMITADSSLAISAAKYGYLGVHLFFMISGFVIIMSADRATPRSFFACRAARLYPAMWVCASFTALIMGISENAPFPVSTSQYLINLTLVPHWFGVAPLDGAYWSLIIEVHFYLAVLMVIALGQEKNLERILYVWLLLSAINYLRPMYPLQIGLNAHWAPLLAAGALLYYVRRSGWTRLRAFGFFVCLVLSIGYELESISSKVAFSPEVVSLSILMMFVTMGVVATREKSLPTSRLSGFLGIITYPLYLIHQNIGYTLFNSGTHFSFLQNELIRIIVMAILLMLAAWGVNKWVEQPVGPFLRKLLLGKIAHVRN
jgi:peptidoglycan/LPS O-acetylase OafA/YrhL